MEASGLTPQEAVAFASHLRMGIVTEGLVADTYTREPILDSIVRDSVGDPLEDSVANQEMTSLNCALLFKEEIASEEIRVDTLMAYLM
jgi:hypothetical protein